MTITFTKTKMAVGLIAVVTLAATAAWAGDHPFNDVPRVDDPDEKFYSEPVQWAWDNALTTGSPSGSDTFKPLDAVTRGENITFNFRYDNNVVQPAVSGLQADVDAAQAAADAAQADADTNADDIADNGDAIAALPVLHWATILSDGTIAASSSGVNTDTGQTRKISTGNYEVDFFVADVGDCHAVASLSNTSTSSIAGSSVYAVARSGDASSVFLQTNDDADSPEDSDFTVQLWCTPSEIVLLPLTASAPDDDNAPQEG